MKEIVPKHALSLVANLVYKEHYETRKMAHAWNESKETRTVEYKWQMDENWHSIKILASVNPADIVSGSESEFITEHYWGFTKIDTTKKKEVSK